VKVSVSVAVLQAGLGSEPKVLNRLEAALGAVPAVLAPLTSLPALFPPEAASILRPQEALTPGFQRTRFLRLPCFPRTNLD
jgi:hypothetical protein